MKNHLKILRGLKVVDKSRQQSDCSPNQDSESNDDALEVIDKNGIHSKKRGRTKLKAVWNHLSDAEKIFVETDKYGQPPTREGIVLSSFLGTIVTKAALAPISIRSWDSDKMEVFKSKMISIVKLKFEYPGKLKDWVLISLNKKWRDYKFDLKSQYFDPNKTKVEISQHPPKGVSAVQWCSLVNYWFSDESKQKKHGKEMARLMLYDVGHKRKDGTYVDENAKKKMSLRKHLLEELEQAFLDEVESYREIRAISAAALKIFTFLLLLLVILMFVVVVG